MIVFIYLIFFLKKDSRIRRKREKKERKENLISYIVSKKLFDFFHKKVDMRSQVFYLIFYV